MGATFRRDTEYFVTARSPLGYFSPLSGLSLALLYFGLLHFNGPTNSLATLHFDVP